QRVEHADDLAVDQVEQHRDRVAGHRRVRRVADHDDVDRSELVCMRFHRALPSRLAAFRADPAAPPAGEQGCTPHAPEGRAYQSRVVSESIATVIVIARTSGTSSPAVTS